MTGGVTELTAANGLTQSEPMPADPPRPERDEKHERILAGLMRLQRSPSAFKTAETREIIGDAYQWLRTIMCDLRGHETALAQAERRAEEAERLATDRLEALRPFARYAEAALTDFGEGEHAEVYHKGLRVSIHDRDLRRAAALAADAQGGRGDAA